VKIIKLDEVVANPGDRPVRLLGALRNYIREQKLQTVALVVRLQVRSGLHICTRGVFGHSGVTRVGVTRGGN